MIKQITVVLLSLACLMLFVKCTDDEHKNKSVAVKRTDANWAEGWKEYEDTWPEKFNIGTVADNDFIAKWDIDVRPDGKGLPDGEADSKNGALIYAEKCAKCHGVNGYDGPEDKLVTDTSGSNTIGNYWPYATTIFDYVRRAMPYDQPGSLSDQEVYDITAYLLYLNKIITAEEIINEKTLPQIEMPAKQRYVLDDRRGGKEVR